MLEIDYSYINKSGVYILHIKDHSYIGSASSLYARIRKHKSALELNKHVNTFLQNCYNKHREITYDILEFCNREKLIEKECLYIKQYIPDLNMKSPMESNAGFHLTKEHIEKIRISGRRKHGQEEIAKFIKSTTGKKRTQEFKNNRSILMKNLSDITRNKLRYKNQFRILSEEDVINIRNRLSNKERVVILAKEYNISISTIYKIKQRERWKNI
jgi:group I intron endonuclease